MTEEEWLTCAQTKTMLRWLTEDADARKLRLFACSCCRAIWYLLLDERARRAVEVAERFADGLATESELVEAHQGARMAAWSFQRTDGRPHRLTQPPASYFPDDEPLGSYDHDMFLAAAETAVIRRTTRCESSVILGGDDTLDAWYSYTPYPQVVASLSSMFGISDENMAAREVAGAEQCAFIRDIFGNPFKPGAVKASWLTSDVLALARGIYDDRAFERMPILADALQDAGCDNTEILDHCRGDGPHVRGCWVVDLVLGKEQRGGRNGRCN